MEKFSAGSPDKSSKYVGLIEEEKYTIIGLLSLLSYFSFSPSVYSQNLLGRDRVNYCDMSTNELKSIIASAIDSSIFHATLDNGDGGMVGQVFLPDNNPAASDSLKIFREWHLVQTNDYYNKLDKIIKKPNALRIYELLQENKELETCFLYADRNFVDPKTGQKIGYVREIYSEEMILLANEVVYGNRSILYKNLSAMNRDKNYIRAYQEIKNIPENNTKKRKGSRLKREFSKKVI